MQLFQRHNYRKLKRIIGIVLLAVFLHVGISLISGFLPANTNMNLASAQLAPQTQTYTIFCQRTPINSIEQDSSPVEVGVKFFADVDGEINAIRFYRGIAIDSGYIVHLWNANGELLRQGMAVEGQQPTPGWQTVQLYPPVPIQAGQTYVASYYASQGQYAQDMEYFKTAVNISPLHIPADSIENPNGVYFYAKGGGFPTQGHHGSNYWVDVVFKPNTSKPTSY
ncbi:DUF4082 domain-containing protein [Tolypothrix sp. PCC 7910]|uniref:DUF4082 domain-containing protein n=1 Tax=Tolypothrix sp. PCC 7910 TaxID=2099387 RepID=UPI0014279577|nr:DUF4082 domain-containing protein [Tolypothrix sp. PCC 7910]QIR38414.1 DUF4082 domain-containing protein [Tolypothrix sp. PCC 7910]